METTNHNLGTMHIYDAEERDSHIMILRPMGTGVQALDEYLRVGAGSPESDFHRSFLCRMGTSLTTMGMLGVLLTANIYPTSASTKQDTANKVRK